MSSFFSDDSHDDDQAERWLLTAPRSVSEYLWAYGSADDRAAFRLLYYEGGLRPVGLSMEPTARSLLVWDEVDGYLRRVKVRDAAGCWLRYRDVGCSVKEWADAVRAVRTAAVVYDCELEGMLRGLAPRWEASIDAD